jgi:hypothetical protein
MLGCSELGRQELL